MRILSLAPFVTLLALATACPPTPFVGDDTGPPDTGDTNTPACEIDTESPTADADGDLLTDAEEVERGTDPCLRDTDGDGVADGAEVMAGSDPESSNIKPDTPHIELSDGQTDELTLTFTLEIARADIGFLIDTTYSMNELATAMASEFASIVADVSPTLPDATWGVATYDDFAYGAFGYPAEGDKPFRLLQQQTTDTSLVQSALNSSVQIHNGGDLPESTIEALHQALTGAGFDQGDAACGTYNDDRDVLPFRAGPNDPFGGTGGEHYDGTTPGTGTGGGMGFRRGALPILVYATDAELRDPGGVYQGPPTCSGSLGTSTTVAQGINDLGGRLIGVHVERVAGQTPGLAQMNTLAAVTNSVGDIDGNGTDEPFVFVWNQNTNSAGFRTLIANAINDVVGAITFGSVELTYEGDGAGFIDYIAPASYSNIGTADFGTPLDFTVHFSGSAPALAQDQLFTIQFTLVGDGAVELGSRSVVIVVPGTGTP